MVTLLALLELARLKVVRVVASEEEETIFIAHVAGAALQDARRARITSDDEALDDEQPDSSADAPSDSTAVAEPGDERLDSSPDGAPPETAAVAELGDGHRDSSPKDAPSEAAAVAESPPETAAAAATGDPDPATAAAANRHPDTKESHEEA